ncbi:microsomal glutathione S-transferase 2 [Tenrec ecaudatus]|uniref:microsomal glutathione S-transferase 2 n=1 Tax=Tenrec ecaudatus TaxID=94439 RepID=UPI003F595B46
MENSILLAAVAILSACQQSYFAFRVGKASLKYKVTPPEVTVSPAFEKVYHAQQNCVEFDPLFMITCWMAVWHFNPVLAMFLGLTYMYARHQYYSACSKAAQERQSCVVFDPIFMVTFWMAVWHFNQGLATFLSLVYIFALQYNFSGYSEATKKRQSWVEFDPLFMVTFWMAVWQFNQVLATFLGLVYMHASDQYFSGYSQGAKKRQNYAEFNSLFLFTFWMTGYYFDQVLAMFLGLAYMFVRHWDFSAYSEAAKKRQNCVEFDPLIMVTFWLAVSYFNQVFAMFLGVAYMYGRHQYFSGYSEAVKKRVTRFRFRLGMLALLTLLGTGAIANHSLDARLHVHIGEKLRELFPSPSCNTV